LLRAKIILSSILICISFGFGYWLWHTYQKSGETNFIHFLVRHYYASQNPNEIRILTENTIPKNKILIRQAMPLKQSTIIYEQGLQAENFSVPKGQNNFWVYFQNQLIGSFVHFKASAYHTYIYKLTFFEDENQDIHFTYSITRQTTLN